MHKRIFALFLFSLFFSPAVTQAQIEVDTTSWNDEELYEDEADAPPPYFAVGGGPIGGVFMANLDAFNRNIAQPFVGKEINNSIFMIGGQGFISVPWVENLRVGGMGYGGVSEQCCVDSVVNGTTVSRSLEYRIGYGGLTLDYVLPLNLGKFWIVPGVVLGLGSIELFAQQAQGRDSLDLTREFGTGASAPVGVNRTHTYHSSFFTYMPQIQFEYSPMGFMMLRASVGYQGTVMGDWEVDQGVTPGRTAIFDDINGNGLVVSLGVFFGLFP
jgi:hypothetical protein